MTRAYVFRLVAECVLVVSSLSCSTSFDPASKIESVRILATAADKPYALPGDTVTTQVLAFDGRPAQPAPMGVWWLPQPCFNPDGDSYYSCYAAFGGTFSPGVDLTSQLSSAATFSFQMPGDVITSHKGTRGGASYGVAVVFVVACAGHVEYVPLPSGAPQNTLPFGCFDPQHGRLGASDFVFAYELVYAFADRTNANPVIDRIAFAGTSVEPMAGIVIDHCAQSTIDNCPSTSLDTIVSNASQELDPSNVDASGHILGEEIWVDYYVTAGKLKHDTMILFDPRLGLVTNAANEFQSPLSPGNYWLWSVTHDNRGGTSWLQIPIQAR